MNNFEVHVRPDDFLIPACHEGMNRSQVYWKGYRPYFLLLKYTHFVFVVLCGRQIAYLVMQVQRKGLPPFSPGGVCVPHGAESGFDPYQGFNVSNEDNMYSYIHGKILPRGSPGEWVRC